MTEIPRREDFPSLSTDKLRYADTDRQGHVNNAVFAVFLETGRVELVHDPAGGLPPDGCEFVIARLELDYRGEIEWPGEVLIGSRVEEIGRSSVRVAQAVFQGERCVASASTVLVLIDQSTRRPAPIEGRARERLAARSGEPPSAERDGAAR